MEGIELEHFNTFKASTIPMAKFHYHLSDKSYQYSSAAKTHIYIIILFVLSKGVIASLLVTMWDNVDSCENNYPCESAIYLPSFLALEFCIIIYISFSAPGHVKYAVDVMSARDKCMLNFSMENILNPEIICDDHNFYKFM